MKKNKRGDIAITLLVIVVIILCTMTLFAFYTIDQKRLGGINSFSYLQEVYTLADSVEYSKEAGARIITLYNTNKDEVNKYAIVGGINVTKEFFDKDLKTMKVVYTYAP